MVLLVGYLIRSCGPNKLIPGHSFQCFTGMSNLSPHVKIFIHIRCLSWLLLLFDHLVWLSAHKLGVLPSTLLGIFLLLYLKIVPNELPWCVVKVLSGYHSGLFYLLIHNQHATSHDLLYRIYRVYKVKDFTS